jgi:hypothetical protein
VGLPLRSTLFGFARGFGGETEEKENFFWVPSSLGCIYHVRMNEREREREREREINVRVNRFGGLALCFSQDTYCYFQDFFFFFFFNICFLFVFDPIYIY